MPQLFPFVSRESEETQDIHLDGSPPQKRQRRGSFLKNLGGLGGLWKRHQGVRAPDSGLHTAPIEPSLVEDYFQARRPSLPDNDHHHISDRSVLPRAVPSLPRPQTFRRQESERREKLLEIPRSPTEKRTLSLDRRRVPSEIAARRPLSPKPVPIPSISAPEIVKPDQPDLTNGDNGTNKNNDLSSRNRPQLPPLQIPNLPDLDIDIVNDDEDESAVDQNLIQEEYDRRWILNLSMHFRDKSNREKFFVTYAETPTKWRRLTISLDYRNAPPESLEADLSTLHYQRDKSFQIYEAIRESLPDIQYYNTVTNLKLETTRDDGQLHVHVREDANEIIQYPAISLFDHVNAPLYPENDVEFISHLSGFVYKVRVGDTVLIKKEIPGPDTVDEFLYEVNTLDALLGCKHVIQLEGLVTDRSRSIVKGLLISYGTRGALVDMIYDLRGTVDLPWHRREKWAKQIVQGLSDIHEAGFVQGDFTLSNIVIDDHDDAQIIDINRRGCPVGWEPPELGRLIDSGQRIGMCISVKTDLYQLGMVLWALAEEIDEPERVERPLPRVIESTPTYFRRMIENCLSEHPQGRSSAKRLLRQFPRTAGFPPSPNRPTVEFAEEPRASDPSVSTHRSDKEYIDPDMAVTLEDVNSRHRRRESDVDDDMGSAREQYLRNRDPDSNPASSTYRLESSGSWVVTHRGRSPISSRRGRSSPIYRSESSSQTSLSRSPPSRGHRRRGSDCSADGRGLEVLPPPQVDGLGIHLQDHDTPAIEDTRDGQQLASDRRLNALRDYSPTPHSPLMHTDSGFDEHMDIEHDFGFPGVTYIIPHEELQAEVSPEPSEAPETKDLANAPNPPTPESLQTPTEATTEPTLKVSEIEGPIHGPALPNQNLSQHYETRQPRSAE